MFVARQRRRAEEARGRGPAQRRGADDVGGVVARLHDHRLIDLAAPIEQGFAAGEPEQRQACAAGRRQGDLELDVAEARHDVVLEAVADEPIVGAAGRRPPRAGGRARHAAFEQDVASGQADRSRRRQPPLGRAVAGLEVDDRRQAAAETRLEPRRVERDVGCRRRIEEAGGELTQALDVVDLDAVEDDEVVLRAGTADRQLAVLVGRRGDAGHHLQALNHVVEAAGHLDHGGRVDSVAARTDASRGALVDVDGLGDAQRLDLRRRWCRDGVGVDWCRRPGVLFSPCRRDHEKGAAWSLLQRQAVRLEDLQRDVFRAVSPRLLDDAQGRRHQLAAEDDLQPGRLQLLQDVRNRAAFVFLPSAWPNAADGAPTRIATRSSAKTRSCIPPPRSQASSQG